MNLILTILSELFVNLAAGWFAAAFIIPITSKKPKNLNFWLLTINILFGIVCLVLAFLFRRVTL